MTIRTRLALTAGTAVSVAVSLLVATGSPAAAAAVPPWEPDPGSIGSLSFYDASGAVVTGGNISDAPFAAYVRGSVAGRAGDTKATLFGYLPKNGVDIGAWTGEALTASTTYPNAAAPGGLGSTALPVVSVTSADFTLATLVADLPNTAVDAYQGLYQLRLKTSGPGNPAGAEYQSADILVTGSTWTQVYPEVANTDCDGNSAFDFNGDGAGDLVVGEPGEDVGSPVKANAGVVNIVYGSADGKTFGSNKSIQLTEESVGLVSAANDRFGASVLSGAFDGTGCRDLVIGIPGKNGGAGQAVVVFFDANGVSGTQLLGPGVGGTAGTAAAGDGFGTALATSQGSDPAAGTLWVGSPGKDVGTAKDAGAVTIFHRTASGFDRAGATTLTQTSTGVPGNSVASDKFGGVLADRGGSAGIIVGLPNKEVGTIVDAGQIYLGGPTGTTWTYVNQNTIGLTEKAEAGDQFGASVAGWHSCTASPGTAEIVGSPGEDVGTTKDAGIVTVVDQLGTSKVVRQGSGLTGSAETSDRFGATLVVDHDGRLIVGVPGEDVGSPVKVDAGLVEQAGLTCTVATKAWSVAWSSTLSEGAGGVPGTAQAGDKFGSSLTARFDTAPDASEVRILAVGVPGEASGTKTAAGAVFVFPTWKTPATGGATGTSSAYFNEATVGIAGSAETSDGFGAALDRAAQ